MGPPDVSAGKRVLILNGPHRDTEALLEGIDEKNFRATLTLDSVSWLFEQQVYVTMNSTADKKKKKKEVWLHPSRVVVQLYSEF